MSESLDLVSLCCRAHVSRTLHGETPYRCAKCGEEGDAHRPIRPDRGVPLHGFTEFRKEHG